MYILQRIAIIGRSLGSVTVGLLVVCLCQGPDLPWVDLTFRKRLNSNELAEQHWYNASAFPGCGMLEDVLSCMRIQNTVVIKAAAKAKNARRFEGSGLVTRLERFVFGTVSERY
jgi:hypothetical protein